MTTVHAFNPAEALILDEWSPPESTDGDGRVAILGVDDPAMAEVAAERAESVAWYPRHVESLARRPRNVTVADTVVPPPDATLDVVLLPMPQGRYLNRLLVTAAHAALRPGGELWVAGPSSAGAKPTINDAASLFGHSEVVAFKHRQRLARCVKQPDAPTPDWATEPGVAPDTYGGFDFDLDGVRTTVRARPGVFAWNGLDDTTRLLLEHLDIPQGAAVANPCCGAGTLGLHAAHAGASHVTLTDHDLLAVAAARAAVAANHLDDRVAVHAAACDRLPGERRYDLIVAFPPMDEQRDDGTGRLGPRAVEQLIAAAPDALAPDGRLVLAVPAHASLDKPLRRANLVGQTLAESRRAVLIEARLAQASNA